MPSKVRILDPPPAQIGESCPEREPMLGKRVPAHGWFSGDGHRRIDRTVSGTGGDVEGPKATGLVGVNTAVRAWLPVDRVEVFRWAMPPGLTGCGSPSGVVPSVNWMVPAAPWGVTWAMRFTGLPAMEGLGSTFRVVW